MREFPNFPEPAITGQSEQSQNFELYHHPEDWICPAIVLTL